jgi:hypothetical protein
MHMVFFWLIFSVCAVTAWLIGYGMGYLRGVREANIGKGAAGDYRFNGEWEAAEDGNLRRE